ncbi:energy-coupling factor transporter transmembrane component T [Lentilactobacillus otakiensis]|uniref:energy-coupling factor transporter transmembrane component T n=1 Tax=Lentilactobacillus otakiensis TaxID=481720 RepID=UPI00293CA2B7|nr:energy-coupling factor transporter transmembrane component T [Lentilactobacillus otakiensis]MDV3517277.1 energy-coupling factor transporter transmembrane component T [Lentilactobacillus otakiensis]
MTDQSMLSGNPAGKSRWFNAIDPISKLLLILDMALLSFASTNLLLETGLITGGLLLLLFSKVSSTTVKALGFSLFLIFTMLVIQGLFYSKNQTVWFSIIGINFYKEGLIYATTLGSRVLVIILASGFFMVTTSISENAKYLEQSGLSYKTVYVLMSVCYILPEIMGNMRKIQQAQRVRGVNPQKTVIQKLKSVLPVLIPLVIKTLDQSMTRSISLQLRGFDNPNRKALKSTNRYRLVSGLHIGLTFAAIILIGWKLWTKISGLL